MYPNEYTYSWQDIVDSYTEFSTVEPRTLTGYQRQLRRSIDTDSEWYGGTTKDMVGWFKTGYDVPRLDESLLPDVVDANATQWKWTDDPDNAEYCYEMDYQGELDYYMRREKTRPKVGIKVKIATGFRGSVRVIFLESMEYGVEAFSLL